MFFCFSFQIEVTSLCMCVSISATVALFCLFAPKIYIVLCQPHKNVRQGAHSANNKPGFSRHGAFGGRQSSFGSFPIPIPLPGPMPVLQPMVNGEMHNNKTPNTRMTQTTFNDVFNDSIDDLSCDEVTAMNNNDEQQMEADI